jgi:hypothetical protein
MNIIKKLRKSIKVYWMIKLLHESYLANIVKSFNKDIIDSVPYNLYEE